MNEQPKQPPSPAVAELKAVVAELKAVVAELTTIKEKLSRLDEDFDEFHKSLSLNIALGIIGAVIALGIIWVILVVIITQIR